MDEKITVQLTGENGNIFNIVGAVVSAMREENIPEETITKLKMEVITSESYDDALRIVMTYVDVE